MELLLIRHARPERVIDAAGAADPALDDEGVRQAELLADWLRGEAISAVCASPLRRARQTAAPLASRLGLEVEVVDGLAEWDRDASAYIPIEELKATNHPWWDAMSNHRWDELGVDMDAFVDRVVTGIDQISGAHPSQRVAVVCHGGVINAFVATMLGLAEVLFFEPGYTSISRVFVSRAGVRSLASLNETAHLRASLPRASSAAGDVLPGQLLVDPDIAG